MWLPSFISTVSTKATDAVSPKRAEDHHNRRAPAHEPTSVAETRHTIYFTSDETQAWTTKPKRDTQTFRDRMPTYFLQFAWCCCTPQSSPSTEKSWGRRAHLATLCALDAVRALHAFMALSRYSFHCRWMEAEQARQMR